MQRYLTILIISIFLQPLALFAQQRIGNEGNVETQFRLEKERNKQRRIKQITELYGNSSCTSDSGEVIAIYKLDKEGNLIEFINYLPSQQIQTTLYGRNEKGDCISRMDLYTGENGRENVRYTWYFTYDSIGRIVREERKHEKETVQTNVYQYNNRAQLTEQTTNNKYKWTMEYDDIGNVIQFRSWKKDKTDSFRCSDITEHTYQQKRKMKSVKKSATTLEVLNETEYKYDSLENVVEIIERRMSRELVTKGAQKKSVTEYRTIYLYDGQRKVLKIIDYEGNSTKPFLCTFFQYELWAN